MRRLWLVLLIVLSLGASLGAQCTSTTNLGLCKGARGTLEWDQFLNTNFDLIDGLALNTTSTAQTKTGTLTLGGLKLTGLPATAVLVGGASNTVTYDASLIWDAINKRLGIGTTPTVALDVAGTLQVTGLKLPTNAVAGYILTADSSGNATWQANAAGSGSGAGGWALSAPTVALTTATNRVAIGAASDISAAKLYISSDANVNALKIQNYSLTGTSAKSLLYMVGTWNTTGTPTLIQADLTNTASNAASRLLALNVGGVAKLAVGVDGSLTAAGTATVNALSVTTDASVTGKVTAATLKVTTGASVGKVLMSDSSGNAVWTTIPSGTNAVPTGMIALFDQACPVGWTSISGQFGDPLYERFPMGVASYDGTAWGDNEHTHDFTIAAATTGSAADHTHTVTFPSTNTATAGKHTHALSLYTQSTAVDHTHTLTATTGSATGAVGSAASGDDVTVIVADAHTHTIAASTGGTNTATDHVHAISGITDNSSTHYHTVGPVTMTTDNGGSHTHSVGPLSGTTTVASSLPPYVGFVYCKKQ